MGPGDRPVVGVDPQLVEERRVGQRSRAGRGDAGASAWIVPRSVPSRAAISGSASPSMSRVFQVDRVVRGAGHREQVVRPVVEEDLGDGARRAGCRASTSSAARSAQIRSSRRASPSATRSRSRHCLITNGSPAGDVDPQHDVRDPAAQLADRMSAHPGHAAGLAEVVGGIVRVQFPHGSAGVACSPGGVPGISEQAFEQELELADLDLAVEGVVEAVEDGDGQRRGCSRSAGAG